MFPCSKELKERGMHQERRPGLGKAHRANKNTVKLKSETNALATLEINAVNIKQTAPAQSSTQTRLDLWHSDMGDSLKFRHRNPSALPTQNSPMHSERTLVYKQP
jgi:hypothetical protein